METLGTVEDRPAFFGLGALGAHEFLAIDPVDLEPLAQAEVQNYLAKNVPPVTHQEVAAFNSDSAEAPGAFQSAP